MGVWAVLVRVRGGGGGGEKGDAATATAAAGMVPVTAGLVKKGLAMEGYLTAKETTWGG
mgnify:CR=1 FL=1